jgi:hypothetical protein
MFDVEMKSKHGFKQIARLNDLLFPVYVLISRNIYIDLCREFYWIIIETNLTYDRTKTE